MRALSIAADARAEAASLRAFELEVELESMFGAAPPAAAPDLRVAVATFAAERAPRRVPAIPATAETSAPGASSAALPRSAPSLLESIGISDPVDGASATLLGDADPYMREVERETAPYRIARAKKFRDRACDIIARKPADELPPTLAEGVPDRPGPPPAASSKFHPPMSLEMVDAARLDRLAALQRQARWHLSRATGSLERFPRVRDCGDAQIIATCNRGCGVERTSPAHCAVGRLCMKCRARSAQKRKTRFDVARELALSELRHRGVLAGSRRGRVPRGGKWDEKFMTLTIPHVEVTAIEGAREACEAKGIGEASQSVAARIELVFEAWRYFSLQLQRWGRKVHKATGKTARIAWYRAFEWNPSDGSKADKPSGILRSDSGLGHPHLHVWIVCPYLDKHLIDTWWRAALRRAGLPWSGPLVTDIGEWRMPGKDRGHELIKGTRAIRMQTAVQYIEGWSIVDMMDGARIPAEVAARLYEALDAHRLVQTSSGLLEPVIHLCPFCQGAGFVDVRIVKPTAAELAARDARGRAPPSCAPS
jgi:hypothetical protein